jgi:hypothetical protein
MKPIGYRGGYLTPRTVVLQSQDGDSAILDKKLHDTILKKYPNAVPYFLEDGKPVSYAIDGDVGSDCDADEHGQARFHR